MRIFDSFDAVPKDLGPIYLSIGNFDGVHRGHQAVVDRLVAVARENDGLSVVVTFSNHPSEVLRPNSPACLLCKLPHRLQLIEACGVDIAVAMPFTKEFSLQAAEEFVQLLLKHFDLAGLVLGHDSVMGHDRGGTRAVLEGLSKHHPFTCEYIEPHAEGEAIVSSTDIRHLVCAGKIQEASELLGRAYSITGVVLSGTRQGSAIGYPTLNIDVSKLCLPPSGVYTARVLFESETLKGIANLGLAPTLQERSEPILEVFLLDAGGDMYGRSVEVELCRFIREERRFESIEDLVRQIELDVKVATDQLA